MSLYFEDFADAAPVQSDDRTITEVDVMAFARLTGDFMKLHTDEEYAKTTKFGGRIAHGALVFSVSIGLATAMQLFDDTLIAFAGVDKLRFVAPVFLGDSVHVVKKVVERKAMGAGQGTVTFETRVLNQHGELVLAYRDRLLVKRRPT
ncbi:MAG: MaoC family dehydratase N-terminal domain-containing protein [Acidobacteria bacterium]|nr:MaoC family dehydratase N-terminal domain-containing protein [Acidobacteriota bacterium]